MSDFDSSGKGGKRGSKGASVWDHLRTIGQGVLDGFAGGGKPAATSGKGVQRSVSRQDPLTSERRVAASQVKRSLRAWRDRQDADGGATGVQRKPQIPSGGGAPLPGAVKSKMEGKLGANLSDVKIHTGGDSEKASEDLNAKAFTVGNDVHFGSGQFDPSSKEGEKLIAHELTHVVQGQRGGGGDSDGGGAQRAEENEVDCESEAIEGSDGEALEVSNPDEPAEKEADEVSEKVVEGEEPSSVSGGATASLSRSKIHRAEAGPITTAALETALTRCSESEARKIGAEWSIKNGGFRALERDLSGIFGANKVQVRNKTNTETGKIATLTSADGASLQIRERDPDPIVIEDSHIAQAIGSWPIVTPEGKDAVRRLLNVKIGGGDQTKPGSERMAKAINEVRTDIGVLNQTSQGQPERDGKSALEASLISGNEPQPKVKEAVKRLRGMGITESEAWKNCRNPANFIGTVAEFLAYGSALDKKGQDETVLRNIHFVGNVYRDASKSAIYVKPDGKRMEGTDVASELDLMTAKKIGEQFEVVSIGNVKVNSSEIGAATVQNEDAMTAITAGTTTFPREFEEEKPDGTKQTVAGVAEVTQIPAQAEEGEAIDLKGRVRAGAAVQQNVVAPQGARSSAPGAATPPQTLESFGLSYQETDEVMAILRSGTPVS